MDAQVPVILQTIFDFILKIGEQVTNLVKSLIPFL